MKKIKHYCSKLFAIFGVAVLVGCASEGGIFDPQIYDHIDRKLELSRDDYDNMARPKGQEENESLSLVEKMDQAAPMPEIAQILAAPKPPRVGKTKLVSLTVTDDVPLKDVLIELARLAEVDLELGSGIRGGISFIARDKPFSEVISRVADLAGLRYSINGGVLRVERDTPYVKNYSVDFLNVVRNSESDVSIATDVLSIANAVSQGGGAGGAAGAAGGGGGGAGGGGQGFTTGTSTSITTTNESDFWEALQGSLQEILNAVMVPELDLTEGEEPLAQTAAGFGQGAGGIGTAGGVAGAVGGAGNTAGQGAAGAGQGANGAFFVINRQAGILSVSATQRQHEKVAEYLKLLERNVSAQVLIEAKILEVELDESFQSGIDWTAAIGNTDLSISFPESITNGATVAVLGPGRSSTGVGAANPTGDNNLGVNLDALVQFTERFGTSRTLSSPRLHALHNQQAVLTFAENQVFFEVNIRREDDQVVNGIIIPGVSNIETTRRSVPIGIVMTILPSINLDRNEVTLSVRPTLSRQTSSVTDPGSALVNADLPADLQFNNEIPVIEVRELDSVMKVRSGSVMVIGGLMEEIGVNTDTGIPFASGVPWLGNLFKSANKANRKRELIIFIKASIVTPEGNYHDTDKTMYEKFADDPRPLVF